MKITLESTDQMATINGVPVRLWQGKSDQGIGVVCLITRVVPLAHEEADLAAFNRDLLECAPPVPLAQALAMDLVL